MEAESLRSEMEGVSLLLQACPSCSVVHADKIKALEKLVSDMKNGIVAGMRVLKTEAEGGAGDEAEKKAE